MSWKRYLRKKNRYRKHLQNRNRHHLVPRSRGGGERESNLLLIDIHKHEMLHKIFGNRTLDEIIEVLIRVARAKRRYTRGAE